MYFLISILICIYSGKCTAYSVHTHTECCCCCDATLNRCKAFFLLYKKIANPMKPYVYYIFTYRLGLCAHIRDLFPSSPFSSSNASLERGAHTSSIFRIFSDDFFPLLPMLVVDMFSVVAFKSLFLSSACCVAFSFGRKFNDSKWEKRKWDRFEYVAGHVFVFFSSLSITYPYPVAAICERVSFALYMYVCVCVYLCIQHLHIYIYVFAVLCAQKIEQI